MTDKTPAMPEPTQEQLDAFIKRAGFSWGWQNLESSARRMAERAVSEIAALQSAQPAAAPDDDAILAAGHRLAWRYKHSGDPKHSSTYTFNRECLLQFASAILALRPQAVPMTDERLAEVLTTAYGSPEWTMDDVRAARAVEAEAIGITQRADGGEG